MIILIDNVDISAPSDQITIYYPADLAKVRGDISFYNEQYARRFVDIPIVIDIATMVNTIKQAQRSENCLLQSILIDSEIMLALGPDNSGTCFNLRDIELDQVVVSMSIAELEQLRRSLIDALLNILKRFSLAFSHAVEKMLIS